MIDAGYSFAQAIVPVGSQGAMDVLLRFHPQSTLKARRKLNIALVIDRSGSMAGNSLRQALKAAEAVIDQLATDDIISIVAFDDVVTTVVAPQTAHNKTELKAQVRRIRAGGTTNLSGGWLEGCKQVKKHYDAQAINRVLLLTDGQANEGITDKRLLIKTAGQKAEEGIVTTTLGFGSGFEEDLLVGMARAAGGNFYFIQSSDDAESVFSIELDTLKSVIAQNLQLELTPDNGITIQHLFSLAKTETHQNTLRVNLGDVFVGEDRLLGLTLQLPELKQTGALTAIKLRFQADVVVDDRITHISQELPLTLVVGTMDEAAAAPTTGIRSELALLKIAHAKELALEFNDRQQHLVAEQVLLETIKALENEGLHESFAIAEEIEQLRYFAQRFANKTISSQTRKELRDQSFQGLRRNRADLATRGTETGNDISRLPVRQELGHGVELVCVREHGKLRIKVCHTAYNAALNIQFPRAIRAEGAKYVVDSLELSADGSFYRVHGQIHRLVRAGESDFFSNTSRQHHIVRTGKASKGPASAADLEVTQDVGNGILVQCVNDRNKLRARVVSDGFDPTWNMRFPRSIREEGLLYVVDEVITGPDGKSYIACGKVRRFEQV